jgi:flavin-dependent dehydrogenase
MTPLEDVVIAGAGPAGALAACLLARRGARVTLVDRSRFPRGKLCGDTLNPGALALMARHFDLTPLRRQGCVIDGMLLTGPGGVGVRGEYGAGVQGLGITRDRLDAWMVEQAVAAGARFVDETTVLAPERGADGTVRGVRVRHRSGTVARFAARLTFGTDGRRSRLGQACGLTRTPAYPRRWAIGAYFDEVDGLSTLGEMHIRNGHYLGVAPTRDGRANACLVQPHGSDRGAWRDPGAMLIARLQDDLVLGPRFRRARLATPPIVLGPLAVDTPEPGCAGLLLVGDASGFIDPMTGDGIHLALQGAELAVSVAGDVLDGRRSTSDAHRSFAGQLGDRLGRKRRFNRSLRALVGSPNAVRASAYGARVWPAAFHAAIRYAGDAPLLGA